MATSSLPPKHIQVLVIGGGPAGSYAASALAREGINVTLLEASKFPRYHIGESLIPSVRHYLRFIGAEDKLANYGFVRKPGSAIKFNQYKREGYTDFVALGHNNNAWNVVRSEFDQLLLNHARASGAAVYEQTKVDAIHFDPMNPERPVSVSWTHTPPPGLPSPPASPTTSTFSKFLRRFSNAEQPAPNGPIQGTTSFTHVIDASGRAGLISTRYLHNRRFNASLKNVAVWGYWTGAGSYGVGTRRSGAPWFEALTDESGWAWFIPLHNGTTSVGIVVNQKYYNAKADTFPPAPFDEAQTLNAAASVLAARYLSNLALAPGVVRLVDQGKLVEGSVKTASDFSYSAPSYAGPNYRIVGDAGAFIDPFFSSGIHLAMTSALSAAATICASIRGNCSEALAASWHTQRVATSYTRFQVVVLSAYKQIRSQTDDILSDIDEDNYDRAFAYLRPVIQGASEMGARLSESELQKSLDFCVKLFDPTTPEDHERASFIQGLPHNLLDVSTPIIDPDVLEKTMDVEYFECFDDDSGSDTEKAIETKMVLHKVNARRVIHSEYAINNMELENLEGYVVRLEKGKLGLVRISSATDN
ncbi:FAD/NAD(P)-binding domain-containing protein [Macrolepiota fuliginosa MF-IS2]|uniref:FAD/NAD(P)-binding domain-containing protein n=1 Tax=Macrolepiota fuliginosa MF-IS2 TaxID=1400762 RepID=A0A9P5XM21_9AGAR|nr:FAD/NAD(P)-binding domain-containing protein [Macrolepiota fuliginosa MF-IS2]